MGHFIHFYFFVALFRVDAATPTHVFYSRRSTRHNANPFWQLNRVFKNKYIPPGDRRTEEVERVQWLTRSVEVSTSMGSWIFHIVRANIFKKRANCIVPLLVVIVVERQVAFEQRSVRNIWPMGRSIKRGNQGVGSIVTFSDSTSFSNNLKSLI